MKIFNWSKYFIFRYELGQTKLNKSNNTIKIQLKLEEFRFDNNCSNRGVLWYLGSCIEIKRLVNAKNYQFMSISIQILVNCEINDDNLEIFINFNWPELTILRLGKCYF